MSELSKKIRAMLKRTEGDDSGTNDWSRTEHELFNALIHDDGLSGLLDEIDLLESKLEAVRHMAANVDFEQKMEPDEVIEARVYGARWIAEFMGSERFEKLARRILERRRTEGV